MRIIHREHILAVTVAFISGVVTMVSLFLPWVTTGDNVLNAFQAGEFIAESLKIAFLGTAFNFLIFFGGLTILGAILMLTDFDIGPFVIYAGAILTIIFAVLGLIISSVIPLVAPQAGIWVCLCSGVAGIIGPKLQVKKTES